MSPSGDSSRCGERLSCQQSYVAEHNPGFAARRTLVAEPGELECWLRPLLLASVMYAEPHLPCCASTVWQEMNQGVLRGMLERKQASCGRCIIRAIIVRADSTFAQVGQGQQILGGRLVGGRAEQYADDQAHRGRCASFGARHACPRPRPGPAAPASCALSQLAQSTQQCRDGVPGGHTALPGSSRGRHHDRQGQGQGEPRPRLEPSPPCSACCPFSLLLSWWRCVAVAGGWTSTRSLSSSVSTRASTCERSR